MNGFVLYTKRFDINATMKMPGPALTKIACEKNGYIKRVTKIVLGVSRSIHGYLFLSMDRKREYNKKNTADEFHFG